MPPEPTDPVAPRASRRRLALIGAVLLIAALAVVAEGLLARRSQAARLAEQAQAQAVRTVAVVLPSPGGGPAALVLPGRLEAWSRAPIYGRVSGYLKRWHADIGTRVERGQLLAEIETPDLDQQLLQAQAELATARANASLSEATARRWQELVDSGMVSRQGAEEKTGDLAAKQSVVRALQANVERIQALKGFARLVAPFDGVVTARNTDVGALVNAGGATGAELFVVSDTQRLRVYVTVPQSQVRRVRVGDAATLVAPERPGVRYTARVQTLSQAIAAGSGGMLVQLVADNPAGELLPGGFVQVSFGQAGPSEALAIPPGALIFDRAGLRVATVGPGDKVLLKPVKLARDLGHVVEIADGLDPQDRVIDSPPDGLENGDAVVVQARAAPSR